MGVDAAPAETITAIRNLLNAGRSEEALGRAEEALCFHPDDPALRCLFAEAMMLLGEWDDARVVLEGVQALAPSFGQASFLLARCALREVPRRTQRPSPPPNPRLTPAGGGKNSSSMGRRAGPEASRARRDDATFNVQEVRQQVLRSLAKKDLDVLGAEPTVNVQEVRDKMASAGIPLPPPRTPAGSVANTVRPIAGPRDLAGQKRRPTPAPSSADITADVREMRKRLRAGPTSAAASSDSTATDLSAMLGRQGRAEGEEDESTIYDLSDATDRVLATVSIAAPALPNKSNLSVHDVPTSPHQHALEVPPAGDDAFAHLSRDVLRDAATVRPDRSGHSREQSDIDAYLHRITGAAGQGEQLLFPDGAGAAPAPTGRPGQAPLSDSTRPLPLRPRQDPTGDEEAPTDAFSLREVEAAMQRAQRAEVAARPGLRQPREEVVELDKTAALNTVEPDDPEPAAGAPRARQLARTARVASDHPKVAPLLTAPPMAPPSYVAPPPIARPLPTPPPPTEPLHVPALSIDAPAVPPPMRAVAPQPQPQPQPVQPRRAVVASREQQALGAIAVADTLPPGDAVEAKRSLPGVPQAPKPNAMGNPMLLPAPPMLGPVATVHGQVILPRALIGYRALGFGLGIYLLLLLLWFPFAWERKLLSKLDAAMDGARAQAETMRYPEVLQAIAGFEALESRGAGRFAWVDAGASWLVEGILGRQALAEKRRQGQAEGLYWRALLAMNHDRSQRPAVQSRLSASLPHDTPLLLMAVTLASWDEGACDACYEAVLPLLRCAWPSRRLLLLASSLALANGEVSAAQAWVDAAAHLGASPAVAWQQAQVLTYVDADAGLLAFARLAQDTGWLAAELEQAKITQAMGGDASAALLRLSELETPQLSPREQARALGALADLALARNDTAAAETYLRRALSRDPHAGEWYGRLVEVFLRNDQVAAGHALLIEAKDKVGESPSLQLARARLWLHEGDTSRAVSRLAAAAEMHAPTATALAFFALQMRDLPRAREALLAAAARTPKGIHQRQLLDLAALCDVRDQGGDPEQPWQRLLHSLQPGDQDLRAAMTWLAIERNQWLNEVEDFVNEALKHRPTEGWALAARCAMTEGGTNRPVALARCGEVLALVPHYSPAAFAAGRVYLNLDRLSDAVTALEGSAEAYPAPHTLRASLQAALAAWRMNAAEKALQVWRELDPESAERLYWLGVVALRKGDAVGAEDLLRAAVAADPMEDHVRLAWAEALAATGERSKAHTILDEIPVRPPLRAERELVLATVLLGESKARQALDAARLALRYAEADAVSARLRSRATMTAALAIAAGAPAQDNPRLLLVDAVRIDPNNAEAFYRLGLFDLGQGQRELARESFARAVKLYPGYEAARASLAALP